MRRGDDEHWKPVGRVSRYDEMSCSEIIDDLNANHINRQRLSEGDAVLLIDGHSNIHIDFVKKTTKASVLTEESHPKGFDISNGKSRYKGFGDGTRIYDTFGISYDDIISITSIFDSYRHLTRYLWKNKNGVDLENIYRYSIFSERNDEEILDLITKLHSKENNDYIRD